MRAPKKLIALMLVAGISMGALTGCDSDDPDSLFYNDSAVKAGDETSKREQMNLEYNTAGMEMRQTEKNQKRLEARQPAPQIDYSVERANLQERINRWNDPNKISYIYLMDGMGSIVSYMPIKGKVSSVNSKLTTEDQMIYNRYYDNQAIINSPDLDGSYGSNGDAIFFFTTKGEYVEWNGTYFLSDEPMKITKEPLMIYDESKPMVGKLPSIEDSTKKETKDKKVKAEETKKESKN